MGAGLLLLGILLWSQHFDPASLPHPPGRMIEVVEVTGARYIPDQEFIPHNRRVFSQAEITDHVRQIPGVEAVTFQRHTEGVLSLVVREHPPVARIDSLWVILADGSIHSGASDHPTWVEGEPSAQLSRSLKTIWRAWPHPLPYPDSVAGVGSELKLYIDDAPTVWLDAGDTNLNRAIRLLPGLLGLHEDEAVEEIDLRFSGAAWMR